MQEGFYLSKHQTMFLRLGLWFINNFARSINLSKIIYESLLFLMVNKFIKPKKYCIKIAKNVKSRNLQVVICII